MVELQGQEKKNHYRDKKDQRGAGDLAQWVNALDEQADNLSPDLKAFTPVGSVSVPPPAAHPGAGGGSAAHGLWFVLRGRKQNREGTVRT